jgi:hypothetical protein
MLNVRSASCTIIQALQMETKLFSPLQLLAPADQLVAQPVQGFAELLDRFALVGTGLLVFARQLLLALERPYL